MGHRSQDFQLHRERGAMSEFTINISVLNRNTILVRKPFDKRILHFNPVDLAMFIGIKTKDCIENNGTHSHLSITSDSSSRSFLHTATYTHRDSELTCQRESKCVGGFNQLHAVSFVEEAFNNLHRRFRNRSVGT